MNEKENNSIPFDLITRFFSGEASTDDIIDLEQWKAASEENRKTFEQYRHMWEKTGNVRIFTGIDIDIDQEWDTLLNTTSDIPGVEDTITRVKLMPLLLQIAAVVLIGLLLGYSSIFVYHSLSYQKITSLSDRKTVNLPDGSYVVLNKGSVLEFPRIFDKDIRQVRLNGEAFFEVARDITRPFTVRSGSFYLQVLGTSFNVSAYKKNDQIEVTVLNGEVEVYPRNHEEERKIVSGGEKVIYSRKNKKMQKMQPADPDIDAWKNGFMMFWDTTPELR